MATNKKYKGKWWLPQDPQRKIKGTMRFDPLSGATLKLKGVLATSDNYPLLILGDIKGQRVTLYKCQVGFAQASEPSMSAIYANTVFLDIHFLEPDAIKFRNLELKYSYLDVWAFKKPFQYDCDESRNITIKYTQPERVELCAEGYQVDIVWSPKVLMDLGKQRLSIETWFIVRPEQPQAYDAYSDITHDLRTMLTLAVSRAVYTLEVRGLAEKPAVTVTEGANYADDPNYPVTILQQRLFSNISARRKDSKIVWIYRLFGLDDIEFRLDGFLTDLMAKAYKLRIVYDLYSASLYHEDSFIENIFLSLAQALEIYHRRIYGGKYQEDDQYHNGLYLTLVNAIPAGTEHAFRESLKGRLRYENEYSLKSRLKDMLTRYADVYPIELGKKEVVALAKDISDTRNALTHYSTEHRPDSSHIEELAEKMKLLLQVCLLRELGFDSNLIKERLNRNWKHSRGAYLSELR